MPDTPEEELDSMNSELRVDRTAFSVFSSFEAADDADKRYWHSRTPAERLRHVQLLRLIAYGPAADGPIERVLEIVSVDWPESDDQPKGDRPQLKE